MSHFQKPKLYQRFIYHFTSAVCAFVFRTVWRLEIEGMDRIPKEGGVLIAANHVSNIDPPLVGAIMPRTTYFFAKEELFKIPIVGWYIRQLNAFPVKRYEHDIGAFKRAQHLLENGQAVLLFPEGRRSKTGELGRAKPGVGMLAYKANVPVVPVYLHGTRGFSRLSKLKMVFGEPIPAPQGGNEKELYQPFSDSVLAAVAELQAKMYNK